MREALDSTLLRSLRPLLVVLILMYVVLAATKPLVPNANVVVLAGWELVMVAAFACLLLVLRRQRVNARWAHPVAAGITALILIDSALHFILRGEPLETLSFILLALGVAFFFTSVPWFAGTIGAIVLVWGLVAWVGPPFPSWADLIIALFEAVAISIAVFLVRVRTLRRLEALRIHDEERTLDLQRALMDLRKREAQLTQAQQAAHLGSWEWDPAKDSIQMSEELQAIFGFAPGTFMGTLAGFLDALHPDDRSRVRASMERARDGRTSLRCEARVVRPDGVMRTLTSRGDWVGDAAGPRLAGVCQDITEQKDAERRFDVQHAATRVLASAETEAEAVSDLVGSVCQALGWRFGAVWEVDERSDVLRCIGTWRASAPGARAFEEATRGRTFRRGIGIPGRVWASGEPAWIADVPADADSPRAPIALREGLHGAFGFPIRIESQVIGVLEFFSARIERPDPDLLEMMAMIGLQVGHFIERGRTRDAVAFQKALLEAATEASIDGILIVGVDGHMVLFNRRFVEMWGIPQETLDARADIAEMRAVLDSLESPKEFLDRVQYLYDHPDVKSREEVRLKDGRVFDRYSAPVVGASGEHHGRVWYFRDMTDQKAAEARLRDQRDDLQKVTTELSAANKELESFGYTISHDLKAHVRAIGVMGQILQEDEAASLDARGKETLDRLLAETARMTQLISDILELSRTTAGEMLHREQVDLTALAHEVMADLRAGDPFRNVDARIAEGIVVEGDARLLKVVLENLLGNAWKYTSRAASPQIEFGRAPTADGGTAYFTRDNGVGFDPAKAGGLFQPFTRIHGQDFPGTGIGLATVRRIIERHGGRVWAQSDGPGKGAAFWFTL